MAAGGGWGEMASGPQEEVTVDGGWGQGERESKAGGEVGSGRARSDAEASRAVAVAEREELCQEAVVAVAVVEASGGKGCDTRQHTKS